MGGLLPCRRAGAAERVRPVLHERKRAHGRRLSGRAPVCGDGGRRVAGPARSGGSAPREKGGGGGGGHPRRPPPHGRRGGPPRIPPGLVVAAGGVFLVLLR